MNLSEIFKSKVNKPRVLDVGCNIGKTTYIIKNNINCEIIGIDNKNKFKKEFQKKLKNSAKFILVDFKKILDLKKLGKFDIIFFRDIFNALDSREHKRILDNILMYNAKSKTILIFNEFTLIAKVIQKLKKPSKKINYFNKNIMINNKSLLLKEIKGDILSNNFINIFYKVLAYKKIYIFEIK